MDLGNSTRAELIEIIQQLLLEREEMVYEKATSQIQQLTFQYATGYFAKKKIPFGQEQKIKFGLMSEKGEYTNLGLLLSDQCEHRVKCAIFSGEGKSRFRTGKEFSGSILRQLEGSYEYINLYNTISVNFNFGGPNEMGDRDYPEVAIREALTNALLHRDYHYSGNTLINMFTNRLEIISIGGLATGLTLPDIMRGISQTRNKALTSIFHRLKLAESYGMGVGRILEEYKGKGTPTFHPGQNSFVVVLPNMNVKPTETKRELTKELITEKQVLGLFVDKEMISRKDIEELLNCSGFPARKVLTSLLEKNKIQVVGKGRSTRYVLIE